MKRKITKVNKTPKEKEYNDYRRRFHHWSYFELQGFIEFLANKEGIKVFKVPSDYTSQECSKCGHTERGNRKHQYFKCKNCGFKSHSDLNGARIVAIRGLKEKNKEEKRKFLKERNKVLSGIPFITSSLYDLDSDLSWQPSDFSMSLFESLRSVQCDSVGAKSIAKSITPLCGMQSHIEAMLSPQSLKPPGNIQEILSKSLISERQSINFRQDEGKTDGEQLFFQDFESSISDHSQTVFSAIKLKKGGKKRRQKSSLSETASQMQLISEF